MDVAWNPVINDEAYEVCQKRGHVGGVGGRTVGNRTWEQCRWCGTYFRFGAPRLYELDPATNTETEVD